MAQYWKIEEQEDDTWTVSKELESNSLFIRDWIEIGNGHLSPGEAYDCIIGRPQPIEMIRVAVVYKKE